MNCVVGDLAVIVQCVNPVNFGKFVTVLEALGHMHSGTIFERDGRRFKTLKSGFYWWVEAQTTVITSNTGRITKHLHCSDAQIRPIRDTPGDDETLQWAPVPGQPVTA